MSCLLLVLLWPYMAEGELQTCRCVVSSRISTVSCSGCLQRALLGLRLGEQLCARKPLAGLGLSGLFRANCEPHHRIKEMHK